MRVFSTSWKYIRRSPFQATAAIITMFLAFLLGGFFFLISISSSAILQYFEEKPQITVFFTDKSEKADADALTKTLNDTGKILSIKYISKDDALAIYREQNKNDPLLLELVNADILPASLEITATNPVYLKDLEPQIRKAAGVEDVVYQKDVVDSFISWTSAIRMIGAILALLLLFDSLLVVVTVIGMKISMKKEEIEILKLVGASPWYIRVPFIIEGGVYGLVGAGVAGIVLLVLILWARTYILSFLGIIPAISVLLTDPARAGFILASSAMIASMLGMGLVLGMIGSVMAVGRYLKF